MSKERIYTTLTFVFAFMQTLLPSMGFTEFTSSIVTTVLVTLVSVFTIKKQRISIEINNKAQIVTWVLIAVAALGGLNQLLDVVNLSDIWQGRLRTIVAALIGILNIVSKNLFPTDEARVVEKTKVDLKTMSNFKN